MKDNGSAWDEAVKQIRKRYGPEAIQKLNGSAMSDIKAIPTGSLGLDIALGVGGVPKGRIVEIFGPEASGKTTLALTIMASAQREGGQLAFIDTEHVFDPHYAAAIGVDVDSLYVSQPDNAEEALEIVQLLARSGSAPVIVVDSVAALTPKAEVEGEIGDSQMALQARLMSKALRVLPADLRQYETCLIFTNQIRSQVGIMFGNPETTSGGRALRFYASVRLDVRRIGSVKKGDEVVGNRTRIKVVKNKVAPPFRSTEFVIRFGTGIDKKLELLMLAVDYEVLEHSGAYFKFPKDFWDAPIVPLKGEAAAKVFLEEHPEVEAKLLEAVRERADLGEKRPE